MLQQVVHIANIVLSMVNGQSRPLCHFLHYRCSLSGDLAAKAVTHCRYCEAAECTVTNKHIKEEEKISWRNVQLTNLLLHS
jgi:hypothetical protein